MFQRILLHLTATVLAGGILLFVLLRQLWIALPNIDSPWAFDPPQSIAITDRAGNPLYRIIGEEDRTIVTGDAIPDHVRNAFIAVEDRRFYDRSCIDVHAWIRAGVANIRHPGSEGGSTITQQLVRTVFLSAEKSIDRKIREAMLACQLEWEIPKSDILDLYLNWISFGHGISGIEQASSFYFGVSARDLTIAQGAVLAALPQRPTYFSPYGEHRFVSLTKELKSHLRTGTIQRASEITASDITPGLLGRRTRIAKEPYIIPGRANEVLRKMEREGFLSNDDEKHAEQELLTLEFNEPTHQIIAPHFVLWIRNQLAHLPDPSPSPDPSPDHPTLVRTTLDIRYQKIVEDAVAAHQKTLAENFSAKNIAVLLLDRRTREILAYKGNTDFFSGDTGQIDMVQTPRQPGSSFKPILYAEAFREGYRPDSEIIDAPFHIGNVQPKNYEGGYLWRMTMAQALSKSRNIPALKTFFLVGGEEPILRLAASLGAATPFVVQKVLARNNISLHYGWPLALGAAEVPLQEMVQAYSAFADDGIYRKMRGILQLQDEKAEQKMSSNEIVYEAISPFIAHDITRILTDPEGRPEGYWRDAMTLPGIQAAIKTGTSNIGAYPRDVWTLGYTPEFVLGVWVGNADGTPLSKDANGLVTALPLWRDVLLAAHDLRPLGNTGFAFSSL